MEILSYTTTGLGNSSTNLVVLPVNNDFSPNDGNRFNFKIIIGDQESTNAIFMDWSSFRKGLLNYPKAEAFLISAIRNFIRKINFSELHESLENNEISEKLFYEELDKNGDKYSVILNDIIPASDALIIGDLVNKIGLDLRDLSTSEIAEMFSVKETQLISYITYFNGQHK